MENLNDAIEIIGQSVFDYMPGRDENGVCIYENDRETSNNINKFLSLAIDSYILIPWPKSQKYMDEEWFEDEAILDVECKFGSSAYFIPLKRIL